MLSTARGTYERNYEKWTIVAMAKTAAPRVSVTWSKPGRSLARAEDAAIRCVQPGTRHLKLLAVAVTGVAPTVSPASPFDDRDVWSCQTLQTGAILTV